MPGKTLYVSAEDVALWERLRAQAARECRSVSALVADAIRRYLEASG